MFFTSHSLCPVSIVVNVSFFTSHFLYPFSIVVNVFLREGVFFIREHPEARPWRLKSFLHYENCCIIFGNDRATGKDARAPEGAFEDINDVHDSSSTSEPLAAPTKEFDATPTSLRTQTTTANASGNQAKKKRNVSNDVYVGDQMVAAAQIMANEISKEFIEKGTVNKRIFNNDVPTAPPLNISSEDAHKDVERSLTSRSNVASSAVDAKVSSITKEEDILRNNVSDVGTQSLVLLLNLLYRFQLDSLPSVQSTALVVDHREPIHGSKWFDPSMNVWSLSVLEQLIFRCPGCKTLVVPKFKFPTIYDTSDELELLREEEALSLFYHAAFLQKCVAID
ncbi:hypothetical protein Syun_001593 [Stephania yunnanensis]|uniref:Uncharacterized protein n=1 Tax=Stephania yunnanensis TaxID=152371 RepID=A0AAP0LE44_9MAGN